MKSLFKSEIKRASRSKMFYISLLIGLCISLLQFVIEVIPKSLNPLTMFDGSNFSYPYSVFNSWMGIMGGFDAYMVAFLTIFPVLATLPFGLSFYQDMKSGYVKNIYTRISKKDYLIAKYTSTFIFAGIVVVIPMLVNLMLTMVVLPALLPSTNGLFHLCAASAFGKLFYIHPFFYTFIYLLIYFLYGGVFASLALAGAHYIDNIFLLTIFPFVVYYGLGIISPYVSGFDFIYRINPLSLLDIGQASTTRSFTLFVEPIIVGGIALLIYFVKGVKEDAL